MISAFWLSVLLAFLLLILSLIENAITHLSRFELRVMLEKSEKPSAFVQRLVQERTEILVPLQFSIQLTQIGLAVLGAYLLFSRRLSHPLLLAFVALALCVFLLRQLIPKLIVRTNPEKVFLFLVPAFEPVFKTLRWVGWPLLAFLSLAQKETDSKIEEDEEEEPSEEEIQAFLEVGEEEGILEEHDSEMIQSVVEFGDTLVREVMTPRSEAVTISDKATFRQLKELMVTSKHSRIPVYSGTSEQIIGFVSVRQLLAEYSSEKADNSIRPLVMPTIFTTETKRVRELLKELQKAGDYMAIVVNEYGEVAGLVTIEDLVEEIVGEIRDKDEQLQTRVTPEGPNTYVIRGELPISQFEKLLELEVGETEFTTVSGWLVNHLGKVPQTGETLEMLGLKLEILASDRRRIHSLRVRLEGNVTSGQAQTS
ncbi:MAG TPA: hemolysin family protein [Acidobacteriota bacterium]|jgi:CBS domain containing-hemolysin-like protein|nr:hemolysin family protein [Acidobacteriota bacterium]